MATGVQIEIETARRLIGLLRDTPGQPTQRNRFATDFIRFFQAPSGGIPARAGSLLGVADCALYGVGTSGLTITDRSVTFEVVNWTNQAVCSSGDRFGIAGLWNGIWWVISEDCSGASGSGSGPTNTGGGTSSDPDTTSNSLFTSTITNQPVDPVLAPWESAMTPPGPGEMGPGA